VFWGVKTSVATLRYDLRVDLERLKKPRQNHNRDSSRVVWFCGAQGKLSQRPALTEIMKKKLCIDLPFICLSNLKIFEYTKLIFFHLKYSFFHPFCRPLNSAARSSSPTSLPLATTLRLCFCLDMN